MIRLVIADDHTIIRTALASLIERTGEFLVTASCADGIEAFEAITLHHPDVALLDVSMPRMDGITLAGKLQHECSSTRVIILTTHENPVLYERAQLAGVHGYLLKSCAVDDLLAAIRSVAAGNMLMPPVSGIYAEMSNSLTDREREVLLLIANGLTNRMISENLSISIKTVDHHRTNLMMKLGLHSTAEMVRYAYQTGLL